VLSQLYYQKAHVTKRNIKSVHAVISLMYVLEAEPDIVVKGLLGSRCRPDANAVFVGASNL